MVERALEPQTIGDQLKPLLIFVFSAVLRISHDRMADQIEVASNLVASAGKGLDFQKALVGGSIVAQQAEACLGRSSVQRQIDEVRKVVGCRLADGKRPVMFFNTAFLKQFAQ